MSTDVTGEYFPDSAPTVIEVNAGVTTITTTYRGSTWVETITVAGSLTTTTGPEKQP